MNAAPHPHDYLVASSVSLKRGRSVLVDHVSLSFQAGEFVALMGPNGAGKSTLLSLLSREIYPSSGHIYFGNRDLREWSAQELALRRAVLPQSSELAFSFTVSQVVSMGRAPHVRGTETLQDLKIVEHCLERAGIEHLAHRDYLTLSGGERHRAQFARVLAQVCPQPDWRDSRFLLLDEPTSSLDLRHQHQVLAEARSVCSQHIGVIAVLHDFSLASRYADKVVIMDQGRVVAMGPVEETLSSPIVEKVFGVQIDRFHGGEGEPVIFFPTPFEAGRKTGITELAERE
jgi:iron complex transport system ATP-binding protein